MPKQISKIIYCSFLIFSVVAAQAAFFSGFESHVINVTAHICNYSETRTMGYWKTHPSVYQPHLPQSLGGLSGEDQLIENTQEVNKIFNDYNLSMRNKLRGQLLAMKFNIAHFGIGGYVPEGDIKTLDDIVTEADNLLRQDPPPPDSVLETMKDLLDDTNNLHQIRYCLTTSPDITLTLETDVNVDVVINEFLPNPAGKDEAKKPKGEWIELYNKGNEIDVAGWVLYDADDSHMILITSSNTNTGSTIIAPGGFLVVYRNGNPNFALNNVGGDTVRLFNGEISSGGALMDSHTYTVDALEGKSFARIPDGSDNWVDPIPTPGESNILEGEDVVFGPALPEAGEETNEEIINEITQSEIIGETTEPTESPSDIQAGEQPTEEPLPVEEEPPIIEEPPTIEEPSIIEEPPTIEEPPAEEFSPPPAESPAPPPAEEPPPPAAE